MSNDAKRPYDMGGGPPVEDERVLCECDFDGHVCRNEFDNLAAVEMSPRLCTPCLYGCAP